MKEYIVKVTPPRPRSRLRRYFVRSRNMTFVYRGSVPPDVERDLRQSEWRVVYYRIRDTGGEPEFLARLPLQDW